MSHRQHVDGSAGDADYGTIGSGYTNYRQPDKEIAQYILTALGRAKTIINVGAGAGSYEPTDRSVTPVEPSSSMRAQRPSYLAPAVDAAAEKLPFDDRSFDGALATFTVHQWANLSAGLAEMRRVSRGPVVVLSCDPQSLQCGWLPMYAAEMIAVEASRYPPIDRIAAGLGGKVEVTSIPIPLHCTDGFSEAYYGRPEALLDPGARKANSAWSFVKADVENRFVSMLRRDLDNGSWDERFGYLRKLPKLEGSLRLIVSTPA